MLLLMLWLHVRRRRRRVTREARAGHQLHRHHRSSWMTCRRSTWESWMESGSSMEGRTRTAAVHPLREAGVMLLLLLLVLLVHLECVLLLLLMHANLRVHSHLVLLLLLMQEGREGWTRLLLRLVMGRLVHLLLLLLMYEVRHGHRDLRTDHRHTSRRRGRRLRLSCDRSSGSSSCSRMSGHHGVRVRRRLLLLLLLGAMVRVERLVPRHASLDRTLTPHVSLGRRGQRRRLERRRWTRCIAAVLLRS